MRRGLIFLVGFLFLININFVLGDFQVINLDKGDSTTFVDYYGETWTLKLEVNDDVFEGKRACYIEINNLEGTNKFNYRLIDGVPFNVDGDYKWGFLLMDGLSDKICGQILVYRDPIVCEDSDNTNAFSLQGGGISFGVDGDREIKGTLSMDEGSILISDICANKIINSDGSVRYDPSFSGDTLIELSCLDGSIPYSINYEVCPNGCFDGRCATEEEAVENTICRDSDGGRQYSVKGTVKGGTIFNTDTQKNQDIWTDYCTESGQLVEFSCSNELDQTSGGLGSNNNGYGWSDFYNCPNGCFDGRCVEAGEVGNISDFESNIGFRFSSWVCWDGSEEVNEDETSCKSPYLWEIYAGDFCKDKCNDEGICGVSSFVISDECFLDGEINSCESAKGICRVSNCLDNEQVAFGSCDFVSDLCCIESGTRKLVGGGYEIAVWGCEDGSSGFEGGDKCISQSDWEQEISSICEGKCNDEGICGVNDIDYEKKCDLRVGGGIIGEDILICRNSCPSEGNCLPIGYRQSGEYCSGKGSFEFQFEAGEQCDNSFECGSNICISGQCISPSLIERILDFFRRIFGNQGNN